MVNYVSAMHAYFAGGNKAYTLKKRKGGKRAMRYRTTAILLSVIIALAATTGCNYVRRVQDSDLDYGSRQKGDPKTIGSKMYGSTTNDPRQHDNRYFEYSRALSSEVAKLNGVATSVVMLTDKNAYVGLVLDWTAVGTLRSGGRASREQNNTGMNEGVYNADTGSSYWDNRKMVTPYNSYFSVNDLNQISGELKQSVAVIVRRLAPAVEEVHISANMDFVNELVEYAKESWAGRPLEPYTEAFNRLVKYQFAGVGDVPAPLQRIKERRAAGADKPSIPPQEEKTRPSEAQRAAGAQRSSAPDTLIRTGQQQYK